MTQPPSPSAAALALADWMRAYFLPRGPWAHPDNRLDVATKLQEFADSAVAFAAQAAAAERAKPSASDIEMARRIYNEACVMPRHEVVEYFATALAERGARERERAAAIVDEGCSSDSDSELAEAAADAFNTGNMKRPMAERIKDHGAVIAAAIRNQTGD